MNATTLAAAFAATARTLTAAGIDSPDVNARWLVEAAAGTDPRHAPHAPLTDDAAGRLTTLVARRSAREPLQLILGTAAFRTIEVLCEPGVFIPRPETEVLAQIAIDLAVAARESQPDVVVFEPCCGTGVVGLALASEVDGVRVHLGDLSPQAVALATRNRDRLASAGRLRSDVEVRQGDLLAACSGGTGGPPDVIVANPPYLPNSDLGGLDPEVGAYDPHTALAGGPDGHEIVTVLLEAAVSALAPGGAIALEIDARRAEETAAFAHQVGLREVTVRHDLTGAPRFVVARSPE